MPRVTFIYPCVGRFPGTRYVRSWQMQPLAIGVLSSLTPRRWERRFYDDRLEPIDYEEPTDLVALSMETFTARRSYQIAGEYRKRGVPVVMGGYHATFRPDEVLRHADAVCVGDAEGAWPDILRDAECGRLGGRYESDKPLDLVGLLPDRDIFRGKRYFKLSLVETSRGCRHRCSFCSITAFHKATFRRRPVQDIILELRSLNDKFVFLVDDNIVGDVPSAMELFKALKPLRIRWIGQAGIQAARDARVVDAMWESGCRGLLIGFESLEPRALERMNKGMNSALDYTEVLDRLRRRGIVVYGTFVFGFPGDTAQQVERTLAFAQSQKLFMAAFAHLLPFPGTPLHDELAAEGRIPSAPWWLSERYRFGQVPHRPECASSEELEAWCHGSRKAFYSLGSIVRRGLDFSANCRTPEMVRTYLALNWLLRREVVQKRRLPLGLQENEKEPGHVPCGDRLGNPAG